MNPNGSFIDPGPQVLSLVCTPLDPHPITSNQGNISSAPLWLLNSLSVVAVGLSVGGRTLWLFDIDLVWGINKTELDCGYVAVQYVFTWLVGILTGCPRQLVAHNFLHTQFPCTAPKAGDLAHHKGCAMRLLNSLCNTVQVPCIGYMLYRDYSNMWQGLR